MKTTFFIAIFTFILAGCSHQNAFSKFDMNEKQELVASSIQSSKIKINNKVQGIFSAIYLNKVFPDVYNQNEYFFVYVYFKNNNKVYNPNILEDIDMTFTLNDKTPFKIKELGSDSQFSDLISVENNWNKHYLIAFSEEENILNLKVESSKTINNDSINSSSLLVYKKDD